MPQTRFRRLACQAAGLVVLLALLVTTGCEQRERNVETEPPPDPALTREYSPNATTVNVTLRVGGIDMPEIIGSGWTNLVIRNADSASHTFAIRGNGIDRLLPGRIEPGEMQTMRIELNPGTYEVICPDCGTDTGRVVRQLVVARW